MKDQFKRLFDKYTLMFSLVAVFLVASLVGFKIPESVGVATLAMVWFGGSLANKSYTTKQFKDYKAVLADIFRVKKVDFVNERNRVILGSVAVFVIFSSSLWIVPLLIVSYWALES